MIGMHAAASNRRTTHEGLLDLGSSEHEGLGRSVLGRSKRVPSLPSACVIAPIQSMQGTRCFSGVKLERERREDFAHSLVYSFAFEAVKRKKGTSIPQTISVFGADVI